MQRTVRYEWSGRSQPCPSPLPPLQDAKDPNQFVPRFNITSSLSWQTLGEDWKRPLQRLCIESACTHEGRVRGGSAARLLWLTGRGGVGCGAGPWVSCRAGTSTSGTRTSGATPPPSSSVPSPRLQVCFGAPLRPRARVRARTSIQTVVALLRLVPPRHAHMRRGPRSTLTRRLVGHGPIPPARPPCPEVCTRGAPTPCPLLGHGTTAKELRPQFAVSGVEYGSNICATTLTCGGGARAGCPRTRR